MAEMIHTPLEHEARGRSAGDQREFERRQVAAHYEHDPEIFSLVLDQRLAYSTGIYLNPEDSLETAQARKYEHIRNLLQIKPGEKVFDAGCGWGSVLLYLAEHTGAEFQGVTLSGKQREAALSRARGRAWQDRVRIDVRHVEEVVLEPESVDVMLFVGSIVHMHNRETIHKWAARALRPGGRLFISDCFFPAEQRGPRDSAATKYILGDTLGYCRLLTLSDELALIEGAGLDVRSVEDFTSSYVRTVEHWIDNIRRHRERIEALAPGFAHVLQSYMTVGKLSFARRSALEYMILATKSSRKEDPGSWTLPGRDG